MASTPDSESDDPPDILTPILPAVLPLDSPPETTSSSTPTPSDDSPPPPPPSPLNSPPPDSSPPPPPLSPPPNSPPPSPSLLSKTSPWQSKFISSPRLSKSSPPPPSSPPPNSPPPASPPPTSPPPASPSPPNSPPPTSPLPPAVDSSPPVDYPPASSPPPPPPSPTPSLPSPTLSPPSPTPSLPSPTPSPPSLPVSSPSPPLAVFPPPPINYSSPPRPPASTPPPRPPTTSQPTRSAPRPSSKSSSASNVSVNPVSNSPPDDDQSAKTGISVGVVAGVFIVVFALALLCLRRQKRKHTRFNSAYMMPSPYASTPSSGISFIKPTGGGGGSHLEFSPDNAGVGYSKTWFSYEELTAASGGFATQNILGRGGFGCVYKGSLQDGRVVAIKKLKDSSGQGDREFKAEVEIISRVHHRYLVSLVGYCITDFQRLLVYEFVPNGTLHYHLHSSSKPVMQWNFRVKVACGSARGITYLHEDCHPRIIHRDIKSANILIDNNFEAKVADFGLAKVAQELESNTHVSTRVMGTFGYMAPEYALSGKLTEKSDVFSFGVVLLEIITGRKPVDETRPLGDESLVEWARPFMTEALNNQNFDELVDPRLQRNYDRGEMFRMIEAANACVRHSAVKRPRMSQVLRALDTMDELSDISNGMKPGQSGIYDSGEQSAQISLFQRMTFGTEEFSTEHHRGMSQSSWSSGGRRGVAGDSSEQV